MKVKIVRNTIAGGQPVNEGQIVDVSEADGRLLIGLSKAVPASDAPAIETADAPMAGIENADAVKAPRRKK